MSYNGETLYRISPLIFLDLSNEDRKLYIADSNLGVFRVKEDEDNKGKYVPEILKNGDKISHLPVDSVNDAKKKLKNTYRRWVKEELKPVSVSIS